MNKAARKAVNLSVLQRHDPHISDILDSSSHVVVYQFDEDSQAWTKKGVEGTMFVFKRSSVPSYGFFIMNRLGLDNLMADLTGDMALQLTSDYIIYQHGKDIHGIWIYEPTDRDRIGEKLMECCQKAREDSLSTAQSSLTPSSAAANQPTVHQIPSTSPFHAAPSDVARVDPLTRMLSEAMSKARVSETSGAPLAHSNIQDDTSSTSDAMAHPSQDPQQLDPVVSGIKGQNEDSGLKNEIPSFLMAIISRKDNKPLGPVEGSPALRQQNLKDMGSTQSMLLNSLTGAGKPSAGAEHRDSVRSNGPPLSAELLPASVMPSGLYSSSYRPNGANAAQGLQQPNHHASPSSTMAAATLLNRPNGAPNHGSPMQAPAFTYSPGMMPSPLVMPPIPGGPMMRPPAPPPMPFQHHPGLAGGPHHPMGPPSMGMPPPPPPPSAMAGSSFPADAMHAAMGAVGFMQQQQRGFVGHGNDVLSKADFSQQFMGLIQNDPQFMDVLYSNYTAVLARRG